MPLLPAADFKDILQQKWKCLSQCLDTATRNTICTLTGLVSQPGMQQRAGSRRHLVFTYGTLKRKEPNHYNFLNPDNGIARFVGTAYTVHRWPLIVTTKWNLPFLVWAEGHGKIVYGEIYEIDDDMLRFADEFEGHPEVYQRDKIHVVLYDESPKKRALSHQADPHEGAGGLQLQTEQSNHLPWSGACADGGRIVECSAYFLKHIRPSMFELPFYECYSSSTLESNLQYDTEEEISSVEDILKALDESEL